MSTIEDIKAGDIIYSPSENWLIFVTQGLKLVWLSIGTPDFTPVDLDSAIRDTHAKRKTTHLTGCDFFIIGNIKELITLSDEEIDLDRD